MRLWLLGCFAGCLVGCSSDGGNNDSEPPEVTDCVSACYARDSISYDQECSEVDPPRYDICDLQCSFEADDEVAIAEYDCWAKYPSQVCAYLEDPGFCEDNDACRPLGACLEAAYNG